ncbi:MAG: hypothetical protein ACR2K1_01875 [Saprospiraceae bacterium]
MPDTISDNTFDWLADLSPAFAAMQAWRDGSYHEESVFHLVYHTDRPFAISCGVGLLAEHLRRFRFTPEVIQRLSRRCDEHGRALFDESFLNYLQRLRLRVHLLAPPEGMLLLPDEPLAIIRGPYAQILLMESALRWLVWRSSQWATRVAAERWKRGDWAEEDTPLAPPGGFYPDAWKIRAEYIGGAMADDILATIREPSRPPEPTEGLICKWRAAHGPLQDMPDPVLTQIRRVYKGNHALGDIWLTDKLEEQASVSRTSAHIQDLRTHRAKTLKYTRFQQVYQPALTKGVPVMPLPRLAYLRQRTLKQLEAFHLGKLEEYPHGYRVN